MLRRWLAFVLALVFVLLAAPGARADQSAGHTVPLAVLGFDSEDADDQADALTGALRSRVRGAPGLTLTETPASLGMLTAGLKCPARPSAECQQKIADQIKADRYVWGIVTKGPTAGAVTAEIHLFQRGKADTSFKEQFSDNLKDPNDDKGIGKVAALVVERFSSALLGTIVVKVSDGAGDVVLDGDKRVALVGGAAKLEAAPGTHSIEVTTGGAPMKRNVLVIAGKEALVEIGVAPTADGEQTQSAKPFPTRKVVGGTALAAGVVLGVLSVVNLTSWMDDTSKGEDLAKVVPSGEKPCDPNGNAVFCQLDKDAKKHSAVAIVTGSLAVVGLGVGAYLFFVGGGEDKPATARKTRLVPTVGQTNGFILSGSF